MPLNIGRLVQVLSEHGFAVGEAEGGTELTIACPICFDERQRLYISTANGLFLCFHCQARGHLRRLLTEVCGLNHNEAYLIERSIWGGAKRRPLPGVTSRPVPSLVDLPPGLVLDTGTGLAAEYLQGRGLSTRWVREFGIGYCLTGQYHHRVIVPVATQKELRTFVARTWLRDERRKVLMPKGSQATRALFGYDKVLDGTPLVVILVEGCFDAMRMWELGYENTLATLGAHTTDLQRVLLKQKGFKRIVLLRDGDQAGREAAAKESQELLAAMLDVSIASLPEGVDPGTASTKQIQKTLEEAKDVGVILGQEVALYGLKEVYQ